MATHAHLSIDPMADGTPVLPINDDGEVEIARASSRVSYQKEKDGTISGEEEVTGISQNPTPPEGPTTGKYEEWAYVGPNSSHSRWSLLIVLSICTITVTPGSVLIRTRPHYSRATSTALDMTR